MSAGVINAGRAAVEAFLDDKKLSKDLKGLQSRLRVAGNLAAKVGVAAVAGVAGTALYKIKQQLTELDKVGKSARLLGMDPAELQAFSYAAGQAAGMAGEQFQKAYAKINKGIADAVRGSGEALPVFQALGLDAEKLAGMTAGDRLRALADAMASVPDPGKRAAMSMRLFGEEGARLGLLLAGGSAEIDRLQQKWQRITGLSEPFDTAAIERANDAIDDMGVTLQAVWQKLTLDNASDLAVALEMLAAAIAQVNAAGEDGEKTRLLPWAADMAQVVGGPLKAQLGMMVEAYGDAGTVAGELFSGNAANALQASGKLLSNWLGNLKGMGTGLFDYLTGRTKTWGESLRDAADAADNVAAAAGQAAEETAELDQAAIDAAAAEDAFADSARKTIEKLREQAEYAGKSADEIALLKLQAGQAGDASAELAAELDELIKRNQELQATKDATETVKKMADAFVEEALALKLSKEALEARRVEEAKTSGADPTEVERLAEAYRKVQQAREHEKDKAETQALLDDVGALERQYLDLAESIGRTEEELEKLAIQKLREQGASEDDLAGAIEAQRRAAAARRQEEAKQAKESILTPQELYDRELDNYQRMLDEKLISDAEYLKLKEKLEEQHGIGRSNITTAGGFVGARLGAQFGASGIETTAKEQLKEARKQSKTLERLVQQDRARQTVKYGA